MPNVISQTWWMLASRGVAALIFGVLALAVPGITLLWLVALFAAFALITGAVATYAGLKHRRTDDRWWLGLLLGLASVGAGVIAIVHPDLTALVLVLLMGANAIVTGVLDIAFALRLRNEIRGEWALALAGFVAIAFGVLVFLFPGAGALAMVWLISVYAMTAGLLLLVAAFRARRIEGDSYHGARGGMAA